MYIELIKFNSIESIHLKKIVVRLIFFDLIYIVVCSTMNIFINDVIIKILFNNDAEINYISKKVINAAQLFIRQEINIVIMNFINERARFFDVYKSIFVNIQNIIISTFIFVIERLNHNLF